MWVSERGGIHAGKKQAASLLVEKVNREMDLGAVDPSLCRVCWVGSCHECCGVVPRWAHQVG